METGCSAELTGWSLRITLCLSLLRQSRGLLDRCSQIALSGHRHQGDQLEELLVSLARLTFNLQHFPPGI